MVSIDTLNIFLPESSNAFVDEQVNLEEPIGALVVLDWLGSLDEADERYALLQDPANLPVALAAPSVP